jgi:hypothetical protein
MLCVKSFHREARLSAHDVPFPHKCTLKPDPQDFKEAIFFSFFVRYYVFVLVWHQFSPILISLFQHTRKCEGVRKFVFENPSYMFVFGYWLIIDKNCSPQINDKL